MPSAHDWVIVMVPRVLPRLNPGGDTGTMSEPMTKERLEEIRKEHANGGYLVNRDTWPYLWTVEGIIQELLAEVERLWGKPNPGSRTKPQGNALAAIRWKNPRLNNERQR